MTPFLRQLLTLLAFGLLKAPLLLFAQADSAGAWLKWEVSMHEGPFRASKPDFGPYTCKDLDSPRNRSWSCCS
jgi:hypothetical protein